MLQPAKKIILNTFAILSFAFVALIIILVAHEGLLYYAHDMNPDYARIDRCVDLGGQWNTETRTCFNDHNEDSENHAIPQSGKHSSPSS